MAQATFIFPTSTPAQNKKYIRLEALALRRRDNKIQFILIMINEPNYSASFSSIPSLQTLEMLDSLKKTELIQGGAGRMEPSWWPHSQDQDLQLQSQCSWQKSMPSDTELRMKSVLEASKAIRERSSKRQTELLQQGSLLEGSNISTGSIRNQSSSSHVELELSESSHRKDYSVYAQKNYPISSKKFIQPEETQTPKKPIRLKRRSIQHSYFDSETYQGAYFKLLITERNVFQFNVQREKQNDEEILGFPKILLQIVKSNNSEQNIMLSKIEPPLLSRNKNLKKSLFLEAGIYLIFAQIENNVRNYTRLEISFDVDEQKQNMVSFMKVRYCEIEAFNSQNYLQNIEEPQILPQNSILPEKQMKKGFQNNVNKLKNRFKLAIVANQTNQVQYHPQQEIQKIQKGIEAIVLTNEQSTTTEQLYLVKQTTEAEVQVNSEKQVQQTDIGINVNPILKDKFTEPQLPPLQIQTGINAVVDSIHCKQVFTSTDCITLTNQASTDTNNLTGHKDQECQTNAAVNKKAVRKDLFQKITNVLQQGKKDTIPIQENIEQRIQLENIEDPYKQILQNHNTELKEEIITPQAVINQEERQKSIGIEQQKQQLNESKSSIALSSHSPQDEQQIHFNIDQLKKNMEVSEYLLVEDDNDDDQEQQKNIEIHKQKQQQQQMFMIHRFDEIKGRNQEIVFEVVSDSEDSESDYQEEQIVDVLPTADMKEEKESNQQKDHEIKPKNTGESSNISQLQNIDKSQTQRFKKQGQNDEVMSTSNFDFPSVVSKTVQLLENQNDHQLGSLTGNNRDCESEKFDQNSSEISCQITTEPLSKKFVRSLKLELQKKNNLAKLNQKIEYYGITKHSSNQSTNPSLQNSERNLLSPEKKNLYAKQHELYKQQAEKLLQVGDEIVEQGEEDSRCKEQLDGSTRNIFKHFETENKNKCVIDFEDLLVEDVFPQCKIQNASRMLPAYSRLNDSQEKSFENAKKSNLEQLNLEVRQPASSEECQEVNQFSDGNAEFPISENCNGVGLFNQGRNSSPLQQYY